MTSQMLFFRADTQNALTTVLAGLALTTTTFPKISRLPALVAGFFLVFSMQRPGMVNLPLAFTSLVATSAKVSSIFLQTAGFSSVASARAPAIPLFVLAAPFMAAAFIALGAMVSESVAMPM